MRMVRLLFAMLFCVTMAVAVGGCSGGGADVDEAAEKLKKEMPPGMKPGELLRLGGGGEESKKTPKKK